MTDDRLAELERLCAAAPAGPWAWRHADNDRDSPRYDPHGDYGICGYGNILTGPLVSLAERDGDEYPDKWLAWPEAFTNEPPCIQLSKPLADFVLAARTAVPELLAEVRRLRAELAAERDACAAVAERLTADESGCCRDTTEHIAAAIRSRP